MGLNLRTAGGLAQELGLSCCLFSGILDPFHKYLSSALYAGPASTAATDPPLRGPGCICGTGSFCQVCMALSPREPPRVWG